MSHTTTPELIHSPLLSSKFIWKLTAVIAILCVLTLLITLLGRMVGKTLINAGNTTDPSVFEIIVGNDVLYLPANTIRFEDQRVAGVQAAVDTYFTWPDMSGYTDKNRALFDQINSPSRLIFARISQAIMSRDMSGRYVPIYKRFIQGSPIAGPNGLVAHRLKPGTGYANELIYVENGNRERPYTVRCLLDNPDTGPAIDPVIGKEDYHTQTGCQRDIFLGHDLSVTYRFSIDLLPQWRAIEKAVKTRIEQALVDPKS